MILSFHGAAAVATQVTLLRRNTYNTGVDSNEMSPIEAAEAMRPEWMRNPERNCAHYGPAMFYGSDHAKVVCIGCPVQRECLEYALDNGEYGVWGGTSERERRRIRRVKAQNDS